MSKDISKSSGNYAHVCALVKNLITLRFLHLKTVFAFDLMKFKNFSQNY